MKFARSLDYVLYACQLFIELTEQGKSTEQENEGSEKEGVFNSQFSLSAFIEFTLI